MNEVRARLKQLVSEKARAQDEELEAMRGSQEPVYLLPRHVYRVLCGTTSPAASGAVPCSQVLGVAALGWTEPKRLARQAAVVRADGGGNDDLPAP